MGFYLRKSITVGPLRFNLSNSGIGVSVGVRGLRVGMGPRGNYVHMGHGGIYYRATIPSPSIRQPQQRSMPEPSTAPIPAETHAPLDEIESADVSQIVDSSSRELLNELNEKQRRLRLWPLAATVTGIVLAAGLFFGWPVWVLTIILLAGLAFTYVAHSRDVLAKTVVLFYDFEPEMENAYAQLHSSAGLLAACAAAWHIEAEGKVYDRKYHAGASSLLHRKPTFIRKSEPPNVKTNIETVAIGVGHQTLHFFPDRVLVYDHNGVGAVGYRDLRIDVGTTRFIESGPLPRDAKVVDKTWQYVNKSGGPDRRFKDNKELPVCLYEQISLSSSTGLNEALHVSLCGGGDKFAKAIELLARTIPSEGNGVGQIG